MTTRLLVVYSQAPLCPRALLGETVDADLRPAILFGYCLTVASKELTLSAKARYRGSSNFPPVKQPASAPPGRFLPA